MRLFYCVILTVCKHSKGTPDKMVTQVPLFPMRNVCPICRFVLQFHSWGLYHIWRTDTLSKTDNNQGKCLKTVIAIVSCVLHLYWFFSPFPMLSFGLVTSEKKNRCLFSFKRKSPLRMKGRIGVKENIAPIFSTQLHFFTVNEEGFLNPASPRGSWLISNYWIWAIKQKKSRKYVFFMKILLFFFLVVNTNYHQGKWKFKTIE